MNETHPIDPKIKEFWLDIVYKEGVMQEDLVLLELADLQILSEEVGKVYDRVTGGLVSKVNTTAETVLSLFEDKHYNKAIVQDDLLVMLEESRTMTRHEFVKKLRDYFDVPVDIKAEIFRAFLQEEVNSEYFYNYSFLIDATKLTRAELAPVIKELRDTGFLVHQSGLMTDDGDLAGSGWQLVKTVEAQDYLESIKHAG